MDKPRYTPQMDDPEGNLASWKPPTPSLPTRGSERSKHAEQTEFAIARARLLLGQFRKGEANDPGAYAASIAAVLSRYSFEIMRKVTDPRDGMASKTDWLPTVREIAAECEHLATQAATAQQRNDTFEQTLRDRAEFERKQAEKPKITAAELLKKWDIDTRRQFEARQNASLDKLVAADKRRMLAEYEKSGKPPKYAGDCLISPGLAALIQSHGNAENDGTD